MSDESASYRWEAPVWFCDPWPASFGLLGQTGFFDRFLVTLCAYEEWIDLRPLSSAPRRALRSERSARLSVLFGSAARGDA
ncbi:MAG: hypothetical protein ACRDLD_07390, partial [Thermoleophilaceae bacterium]